MTERFKPKCYDCKTSDADICFFAQIAQEIADNPNLDPLEKNNQIAAERIQARDKGCPHLNSIDPNYDGKNKL